MVRSLESLRKVNPKQSVLLIDFNTCVPSLLPTSRNGTGDSGFSDVVKSHESGASFFGYYRNLAARRFHGVISGYMNKSTWISSGALHYF